MKLSRLFIAIGLLVFGKTSMAEHPLTDFAHEYFMEINKAVKEFIPTINSGELSQIHNMSKRLNHLIKQGDVLGPTVFDKPFGACYAMGTEARALWGALNSARTSQDDPTVRVASAINIYKMRMNDCAKVIDENEDEM